jgi:hypothetical protein
MIKSEVLSVNLTDYINQTKTNNILQNHTRKTKLVNNIQDKQIIELNSKLKNKSLTINDLLK